MTATVACTAFLMQHVLLFCFDLFLLFHPSLLGSAGFSLFPYFCGVFWLFFFAFVGINNGLRTSCITELYLEPYPRLFRYTFGTIFGLVCPILCSRQERPGMLLFGKSFLKELSDDNRAGDRAQ